MVPVRVVMTTVESFSAAGVKCRNAGGIAMLTILVSTSMLHGDAAWCTKSYSTDKHYVRDAVGAGEVLLRCPTNYLHTPS